MLSKYLSITLVLLLGVMLLASCGGGSTFTPASAMSPDVVRDGSASTEVIYVSNGTSGGSVQGLYTLTIGETSATLTAVPGFLTSWGGGHIAAPPAGDRLYFHRNDGKLGVWYPDTPGTVTQFGSHEVGVTMAACDRDGNLYVGNQNGTNFADCLLLVDTNPASSTYGQYIGEWKAYTNYPNGKVDLSGGDIVFDDANNFYMITNAGSKLYQLYPHYDGDVVDYYEAEALWGYGVGETPPHAGPFSGLALRDNAAGDLVATLQQGQGILVIDRDNNYAYEKHTWTSLFHDQGDMSVGLFDSAFQSETAWGDGDEFGKGWAMYFEYTGDPATVTVDLLAGQYMDAGDVTATIDGDYLVVTYNVDDDWDLLGSHLYVGLEAPTKSAPGLFPYNQDDFPSGVYTIALADIGYGGETIYIAAHAVVEHFVGY